MSPLIDDSVGDDSLGALVSDYLEAARTGLYPDRNAVREAHPELARDLERFFAAHDAVERLARPLREVAQAARITGLGNTYDAPGSGLLARPIEFGDYVLLEVLGSGGMGIVYRARHRELKRDVALKQIITGPLASAADVQRFRNEAEAAAPLEHANIVPVHEVGEQDGRHYLTMRLMEGGSLATHLKDYQSDPRGAARLVATVSHAVHHAHQRGTLHRDLKPSNILLDGADMPHVTDFGLARRIGEDSTLTGSDVILGTPSYMAPEQAAGRAKEVTTATDVYGLGSILYALLTGRPPFRGDSVLETLEQVRSSDPESPRRLNLRVDRDLETVVLKAMAKVPAARYATALEVAKDLERWLSGKPIEAQPVGPVVKTWRWAKRNRGVASLLAALVVVLTFGAVWILRERSEALNQSAIALLERDKTLENQRIARQVIGEFVTEIATMGLANEPRQEKLLREKLTKAAQYFEALTRQDTAEPATREDAGHAYLRLGQIHSLLGELRAAEQSFRKALKVFERLQADYPRVHAYQHGLIDAMNELARVLVTQKDMAQIGEAKSLYQQAIELCERLVDESPEDPEARQLLARNYLDLADLLRETGRFDESNAAYERTLSIVEPLKVAYAHVAVYRQLLGKTHRNRGVLLLTNNRRNQAGQALEHARATYQELCDEFPADPRYRHELAGAARILAIHYHEIHQREKAEPLHRLAVRLHATLVDDFPSVPSYRLELAIDRGALSNFLEKTGRAKEARQEIEQAIAIEERLIAAYPSAPKYREIAGKLRNNFGVLLQKAGQLAEAEAIFRQNPKLWEELVDRYPEVSPYKNEKSLAMYSLTDVLLARGKYSEAQSFAERAIDYGQEVQKATPGNPPRPDLIRQTVDLLAQALFARGEHAKAFGEIAKIPLDLGDVSQSRYMAAVLLAGWIPRLERATELPEGKRKAMVRTYADQAVQLLQQCVEKGQRDPKPLKEETAFDPLRGRDDFQQIIIELEAKAKSAAPQVQTESSTNP